MEARDARPTESDTYLGPPGPWSSNSKSQDPAVVPCFPLGHVAIAPTGTFGIASYYVCDPGPARLAIGSRELGRGGMSKVHIPCQAVCILCLVCLLPCVGFV